MIIKAFELEKLKKVNKNIFLLYGDNQGLKNQVFEEVFTNDSKRKIQRFDENEILNNYDNFISSIINKSFFDESKLILILRVTDKIVKLVDDLINKNINDTTIVLNSVILEKNQNLDLNLKKRKT